MASSALVSEAVSKLNRSWILSKLGLSWDFQHLSFMQDCIPLKPSSSERCRSIIFEQVPFLNFGDVGNRCSGAKLVRYKRDTVVVPCFDRHIDSTSCVCHHCNELWANFDDDGYYILDPSKMVHANTHYTPGEFKVLTNLAPIRLASDGYGKNIAVIKQLLDGSSIKLSASWPDCTFKQLTESVLISAGVPARGRFKQA